MEGMPELGLEGYVESIQMKDQRKGIPRPKTSVLEGENTVLHVWGSERSLEQLKYRELGYGIGKITLERKAETKS